jgi:hypothetical protein
MARGQCWARSREELEKGNAMAKNKLSDLRDHLFETLEALKDDKNPMDIARAKAIAGIAQTIINSATVEVKAINALGREQAPGEFFGGQPERKALTTGQVAPPSRALDPLQVVKPEPKGGRAG